MKVLFLTGPTACGKTEYAIRLAQDLDGEIVSADSMQIYRYMDVGSAKPTLQERAQARHWLVDEIDPKTPFNVASYQKKARSYIREISGRGKLPIVSGGTGLYINALLYDMDFSAPQGDDGFRQQVFEACGGDPQKIHDRLRSLDPDAAEAIHPNNVKRMLRAIERLEHGEEKLAPFTDAVTPYPDYDSLLIGLDRDRSELYGRIDRRVGKILEAGLEQEVRSLMAMGFTSADIAMKGIGYKEVIDCLQDGRPAADAAELIRKNTRHYARRQLIWLRRYPQMHWVTLKGDAFDEPAYAEMMRLIEPWLKNGR
ncbi:MAG: tRNA (adenosine(37)-N6)-dimethylallyltransferase MiaA [Firmicutes bacterium]|nr:tRNA (adenosine(37)-N6)-dimethylallyltransferase MiaA [Bacillota bacterium]